MNQNTEIIQPNTITEMVDSFHTATREVKAAFLLLDRAQTRLRASFGEASHYSFDTNPTSNHNLPSADTHTESVILHLKQDAWRVLMARLNMKRTMSTERAKELDRQLETDPAKLPDITASAMQDVIMSMITNLPKYYDEAVKEVFEMLRPRGSEYKTNTEYEISERVIIRAGYPDKWQSHAAIGYHHQQNFHNLDNVFHLLDGKSLGNSYSGPLVDLFSGNRVRFGEARETEYFEIKIHKNGNAHIRFKRGDLVKKLNEIAGGRALKHDTEESQSKRAVA